MSQIVDMSPDSAPLSFRPDYLGHRRSDELKLVSYTEPRRRRINHALQQYLSESGGRPKALHEAMQYAVLGDGKRVRPVLCGLGAEICGSKLDDVLPAACALELIHAFSLVHDDLPAIDNDDLRRGRPSCHVKFGQALAILAGDALFSRAFELLVQQRQQSGPAPTMDALQIITEATGTDGMVGGQVEDICAENKEGDLETLEFIHSRKAGSLMRASLMVGATLAQGDPATVELLGKYGWAIGHAFQIVDDILGETSDPVSLGKPTLNDRTRGKLTYPRLVGLERSQQIAEEKITEATNAVTTLGAEADPLRWMASYVLARSK
jgi:geranylgeranyl diphosphate synthase type II